MALVLDASYTLAIALQEGELPGAEAVEAWMATQGAVVPPLWRFEVANGLLIAARRRRIASSQPARILADLDALPIAIDEAATARAWTATLALAERHGLTVYDAAYLELALRLGATLASRDVELNTAARAEAVEIISLIGLGSSAWSVDAAWTTAARVDNRAGDG